MSRLNKKDLWRFREAKPVQKRRKIVVGIFVAAGILSILNLANWWFKEEHVASLVLFIILSFIFWWGLLRMIVVWIAYLRITKPPYIETKEGLTVAIFTTSSPGEPFGMFDKTLEACSRISYPHTTYLLDDTRDPRFKELAEKHGAVWLELLDLPGAKAGKINAALKKTSEDFILVMDPDHIPFPNFLDEVLGQFNDEKVGFVQVCQAYYNQSLSFVARAAAEQTYGFYGPMQMGMHGYNCGVAIGANCTFRRKALESIGGHGIGLAEDLITAIRIHSRGWKSIYNPVIVSRGLVPEDLGSFCKQQLKWSRGVHEVLFAEMPKLWSNLTKYQRLSYFTICTYYLSGLTLSLFIAIPFLFLWLGWLPADMDFLQFFLYWSPVAVISLAIYLYVQHWFCHPEYEKGLHLKGMFLKFACWPVFLLGFLLSLVNASIPYIPTSKQAVKGFTPFVRPLIVHQFIFLATIAAIIIQRKYFTFEASLALTSGEIWGMVAFASLAYIMSFGGLYAAYEATKMGVEEPWTNVNIDDIHVPRKKVERKISKKLSAK